MREIILFLTLILGILSTYAQLPDLGFEMDSRTALVITDPQNDFLSPNGAALNVVGESVKANHTVENLEKLFKVAKKKGIMVFVSPHYYFKHDHYWRIEGTLEWLMHNANMFNRTHILKIDGFEGSGADGLERYKKYMDEDNIVITNPHKVYGLESNDLALQLRKRGYDSVILAGMSSNLCTESHMRDLVESGFEVAVVKDATAGVILPGLNAYEASLVNFRMIASHVFTTKEIVSEIRNFKNKSDRSNL